MIRNVVLALFTVCLLISCKKSDGPSLQEERNSLITGKKWQLVSLSQDWIGDNGTPVHFDNISLLEEHQRDNYFVFNNDNTFTYNDNIIKGPEGTVDPLPGKWSISADGKSFTMIYDDNPEFVSTSEFDSLTATRMALKKVDGIITNTNIFVVIE